MVRPSCFCVSQKPLICIFSYRIERTFLISDEIHIQQRWIRVNVCGLRIAHRVLWRLRIYTCISYLASMSSGITPNAHEYVTNMVCLVDNKQRNQSNSHEFPELPCSRKHSHWRNYLSDMKAFCMCARLCVRMCCTKINVPNFRQKPIVRCSWDISVASLVCMVMCECAVPEYSTIECVLWKFLYTHLHTV